MIRQLVYMGCDPAKTYSATTRSITQRCNDEMLDGVCQGSDCAAGGQQVLKVRVMSVDAAKRRLTLGLATTAAPAPGAKPAAAGKTKFSTSTAVCGVLRVAGMQSSTGCMLAHLDGTKH